MWPTLRYVYFTWEHRQPGPSWLLAVRVAWAAATGNAPRAALPRRRRTADLDPAHRPVAEFGVQPPDQLRGEQPDLRRPGGRVSGHGQLAVGEGVGLGVRGQVRPDDLRPPAEHRADRGPPLPALIVEQAADGVTQPLRVVAARPPAGRTGHPCRRTSTGPFGRTGLAPPWLAR